MSELSPSRGPVVRELEDLVVGQRYHVAIHDCCVAGSFEAIFLELEVDANEWEEAVFDNGFRLEYRAGGWEAAPLSK